MRKIIHIDMDAFYASVEIRDNPRLRGKPVIVGGMPGTRGVVCTASYEARKFGVHSAMSADLAARLCPQGIFLRPRRGAYLEASARMHEVFHEYTDIIEPLSLDEAYLDVTRDKKNIRSATLIALEIKKRIREKTSLTASAGVSYNKFLAKMASDYRKPNGIFVVEPHQAEAFIRPLPIEKFYGVGEVTARKFKEMGVHTGADLLKLSRNYLVSRFGKAGAYYYDIVRGIDERPVQPERIRKSYSVENTYAEDIHDRFGLITELYRLEKRLAHLLERDGVAAKTVVIKVRYHDFSTQSRNHTLPYPVSNFESLHQAVRQMRDSFPWQDQGIRLLGVGVQNLILPDAEEHSVKQLSLF